MEKVPDPSGPLDPLVPLLDLPAEYDILELSYRIGDVREPLLDVTLRRASMRRRLRFIAPRMVQLNEAFERSPRGLFIRDVSARAESGLRLHVLGGEESLSFFAKGVLERPLEDGPEARIARKMQSRGEFQDVLTRYDPRLAHKLDWMPRQAAPKVTAERLREADRGGAAARFFVISTH